MPREGYQVPTGAGAGAGAVARGSTGGAGGGVQEARSAPMTYICGDCGGSVALSSDSSVACPHCAGRVLYKERTKRMVQFEAR